MKIGIDLGTTNSALAWVDPREAEDVNYPPIHIFEVPQLVAPGKTEPRAYAPFVHVLEDGRPVGVYAREQGALGTHAAVHSVKSWLSNPRCRPHRENPAMGFPGDRARALAGRSVRGVPAQVPRGLGCSSTRLRWAEEDIVLTVPASFDEEARELTVAAATEAGLPKLTLLEEPVAAFYS